MHSRFPVYEFHFSYIQINLCGLKMILLLSFWIVTAADSTATYHRLKNSSVCLNVRKPPPYKRSEWKFNTIFIADDTEINPIYTDRVVYSAGNLSLCINNLTDTDAGIYEVSYRFNYTTVSEKHQVIVQDKVPKPVIIMSKLGSNQSAGLCNITVNCSIQDYWLWSVCDKDGCRRSQKSFSEVNITIFAENRAVVCRGNNHVSTNKASENLTLQTSSPREQINSMASYTVDTIYTLPGVKSSSTGNNTQNTSETATVEEEQQCPTQVDTVYSVLQKPKNLNV
ncbi:intersectin [Sarotherodon galilaeus]